MKPCIGCVYFKACGSTTRTEPCDGRMTKTEQRKQIAAYDDVEWLKNYCRTMRGIMKDPKASYAERNEARMKLNATLTDARKRGLKIS